MPGNTLFSIGEALIDMIPSRVGSDTVYAFKHCKPYTLAKEQNGIGRTKNVRHL